MDIKRFYGKLKKALHIVTLKAKASYAQAGEDLIIQYLFDSLKMAKPSYLEIGTNQPLVCNNTYNLYLKGCYGVCIEPDKNMVSKIKKARPKDTVLNIGIGLDDKPAANFYLFPPEVNGWSTFSEEEAMLRKNSTGTAFQVLQVPMQPINEVMAKYFSPHPNFISLDVEGLDLAILQSIDFDKYKPEVICVETVTFGYLDNSEEKITGISEFMHSKGYKTYADTHINTIYCRIDAFNKMMQ
ncbi:MAG TPA: FkbM family methyltransferase [Chitinophagaceae bacterium]|jgi:FkbM family methyltransferase|nr:FkbM family methyltransferase [Chitinophagaceae bacterium]